MNIKKYFIYFVILLFWLFFFDKNSTQTSKFKKISRQFGYNCFQFRHTLLSYWLTIIIAYLVKSRKYSWPHFLAKRIRPLMFHQSTINAESQFHQYTINVFEIVLCINNLSMFHRCTIDVTKLILHPYASSLRHQCNIHIFEIAEKVDVSVTRITKTWLTNALRLVHPLN